MTTAPEQGEHAEADLSPAALYAQLRHLLELEVDSGVSFAPRPAEQTTGQGESATAVSAGQQPASGASELPPLALSGGSPAQRLQKVAELTQACQRCGLCEQRQQAVPGEGNAQAELMFIGEGPGFEEDQSGRPFVGPAGQLLDQMIQAMGMRREEVFIANVVKCRPPGNRNPEPDEVAACLPYLREQVAAIGPRLICTLGNVPLRALTGDQRAGITRARGQVFTWSGVSVLPTFHPSYLLRNPGSKRSAWEDLKQALTILGRPLPARR